ncbi:YraN family protein [Thalassotalea sp. LPB0316]|uniref:YraN family protein n=1 Tax=Thalassotalea sp. LPB0316 TaxID=2769490 RepID=UPI0018678080|nr:YraN family protein [Thalassotalea sp. LPB0316]QOL25977.1 YraN family protein [Thalassotalea sp. LPB0316]
MAIKSALKHWLKTKSSAQEISQTTRSIGQEMEAVAINHLKAHGLTLVKQNFSSKFGEIDLIFQTQDTLIFVEVKYRKSNAYGGAIHAIPTQKQQKIVKTAQFYMQQAKLNEYNTSCRFDVVAIQGSAAHPEITWLKNAF